VRPVGGILMRRSAGLAIVIFAFLLVLSVAQTISPEIVLTVNNGPGPLDVTLQWTGGQPSYEVFRSADASTVCSPNNLLGVTDIRSWVDPAPQGIDITDLGGPISAQYQTGSPTGEAYTNLIDNNVNTKYLTFNPSAWIQYQAPSSYVVKGYTISSANDAPERDPLNWTLQGSTNGSSWTTIDTRANEDFPGRLQKRIFKFTNTTAYQYYRFNLSNNSGTILQLAEIELFGDPSTPAASKIISNKNETYIYPNPVSGQLYVGGLTGTVYLEVYNSIGQCKLTSAKSSVDVTSLEPGVYFLKVKSGENTGTYKFIKQN